MVGSSPAFASDNMAPVHPDVVTGLNEYNNGYALAYGNDDISKKAGDALRNELKAPSGTVIGFPATGTGANVLALGYIARKSAGMCVIATKQSHINTDECASPEVVGGIKILAIPTTDGKLNVETHKAELGQCMADVGVERRAQPKVISISQTTEQGTVYTLEELKKLREFADKHKLWIHMDGARLSNAAASLGVHISEITQYVDILSFGLTKDGAMGCEIIVFLNKEVCHDEYDFKAYLKSHMGVLSKHRYVAAQLLAMLKDGLYMRNATTANAMCALLKKKLLEAGVIAPSMIAYSSDANALILRLSHEAIAALRTKFVFYNWSSGEVENEVRLMTSWATTADDVHAFVQHAIAVLRSPIIPSLPPSSLSLQPTTSTTTTTTTTTTLPTITRTTTPPPITPPAPTLRLQA